MHPALSIILFTTLSGAGFGLCFWTGILAARQEGWITACAGLVAVLLTTVGLLCSVFHLRRPTRAWRAFSQWRSSWLSREAILAPAALALVLTVAISAVKSSFATGVLGWIAAALAIAAVVATSMIYTQLRAIAAWNSWRTPLLFIAFSLSSGYYLMLFVWSLSEIVLQLDRVQVAISVEQATLLAATLAPAAQLAQFVWWRYRDSIRYGMSSPESATGLGDLGSVRLLEPPHTGASYLTSEMGFTIARKHALKLRWISVFFCTVIPLFICLWLGEGIVGASLSSLLIVVVHITGIIITRWLFFAESRHSVMLYYQV